VPKVSVITPCYNAEKYIGKAIESLQAQTFTDWEHIVIDDGSTDDSYQVVSSHLEKEPRLRLFKQSNGGACNARNSGFKFSSVETEYLLFFDADDCLEPTMLEVMVNYLDARPTVGLAYCDYCLINSEGKFLNQARSLRYIASRFGIHQLPYEEPITPFMSVGFGACLEPLCVLRRSVYERTSGWPEWLGQGHEGIDLFLQFALISEIHFVPQNLYYYRRHSGQSINVKLKVQIQKLIEKWKLEKFLPEEKRKYYSQLAWFYENRYLPYLWVKEGRAMMRNKKYIKSIELHLKAANRYFTSFLPLQQ
jgi:glycosyltransferase involved in cell wall biosynthesis